MPSEITSTRQRKVGSLRRFGVELEVSHAPRYSAHGTPFGQKTDGSVDGDGLEFYSPILQGDDGIEAVENLCAYALANNWSADSSCGYHLHIDCTDLDPSQRKRVFLAYKLTEALWFTFADEDRRFGDWSRPIPHSVVQIKDMGWRDIMRHAWDTVGRYCWCNSTAYESHKTIEIRLHEGTVDKLRVCNWVKAHLRFVDAVKDRPMSRLELTFGGKPKEAQFRLFEEIWGSERLSQYYRRRAGRQLMTPVTV